jgi:hypothetical protein
MTNANENPRGLPVVSPWDVLDAATRGEEWVTFGELKRAREQLATDYAALLAERDELQSAYAAMTRQAEHHMLEQDKAEARAERLAEALRFTRHRFAPYMDNADRTAIDAAISAMEGRE